MKRIIGILLTMLVLLSACTFAASAARPDSPGKSGNPGKPEDAGRPDWIPPVSVDDNPAPEIVILPTGQTDNTPAADHAPGCVTDDGPQDGVDWIPEV